MEIAEKYGMIMPEESVKASAAFQDSVTTMQMTMTGLKNRMLAEFLPAATQITDGLGKMFAGDMSGADDVAKGIMGIASKIREMAPVIWAAAKQIGGQLIKGIMDNTSGIGENAGKIIGKLLTGLISHLPQILSAGMKLIVGLAKGLIRAIPQVWGAVKQIGSKIVTGLGSALWGKITAAANGIKERFMSPINTLKDKVRGVIDKIKGFFSFKVSAPHIPLPHFSISPSGWKLSDLLKGVRPSLGISWYAKGGIFDRPTLVPGLGEAGPEAVIPLDTLWKKMETFATNPTSIVININGATADPKAIAEAVKKELISAQNRRRLAWQ